MTRHAEEPLIRRAGRRRAAWIQLELQEAGDHDLRLLGKARGRDPKTESRNKGIIYMQLHIT